ncbi:hypothetical protein ACQJ8G_05895 [Helicobacter pylori]
MKPCPLIQLACALMPACLPNIPAVRELVGLRASSLCHESGALFKTEC